MSNNEEVAIAYLEQQKFITRSRIPAHIVEIREAWSRGDIRVLYHAALDLGRLASRLVAIDEEINDIKQKAEYWFDGKAHPVIPK